MIHTRLSRLAQAVLRLCCVQNTTDWNPSISYCFVKQQCHSGFGQIIVEVSRSRIIRHTHTHTHTVGLFLTSDQLLQRAAPYTTHNKHKRRICILSAGFEPANPAIERARTYTLECTATGIYPAIMLHKFCGLLLRLLARWASQASTT